MGRAPAGARARLMPFQRTEGAKRESRPPARQQADQVSAPDSGEREPKRRFPQPPARPVEVWINRPRTRVTEEAPCSIAHKAPVSFRNESAILDARRPPG